MKNVMGVGGHTTKNICLPDIQGNEVAGLFKVLEAQMLRSNPIKFTTQVFCGGDAEEVNQIICYIVLHVLGLNVGISNVNLR